MISSNHRLLIAAAVAGAVMQSCTLEPYVITAQEQYTRNFVETFGLIDPNQNWNQAKSATVSINMGSRTARVKVYAKLGDTYYKVADLSDFSGSAEVPLDIPADCDDLAVKCGSRTLYVKPGDSVDLSVARSRGYYSVTNPEDYKVKITPTEEYFVFTSERISPVIGAKDYTYMLDGEEVVGGIIPEGNLLADGKPEQVRLDFTFETLEEGTVLYPMFWQSSSTHTVGLYYLNDPDDPNSIVEMEIFTDKQKDGILQYRDLPSPATASKMLSQWDVQKKISSVQALYSIINDKLGEGTVTCIKDLCGENPTKVISSWNSSYYFPKKEYADILSEYICNPSNGIIPDMLTASQREEFLISGFDSESLRPFVFTQIEDPTNCAADSTFVWDIYGYKNASFEWKENGKEIHEAYAYDADKPVQVRSRGIKIEVEPGTKIGFWMETNGKKVYSHSDRNFIEKDSEGNDNNKWAASTVNPVTGIVYFGFEDAFGQPGQWDYNDILFSLRGVKKIVDEEKPENSIIVDPAPTPPDTPDDDVKFSEESISWLWAVEDLGSTDDFDFNDVVMKITSVTVKKETAEKADGTTTSTKTESVGKRIEFTPLAAGGTMETYIHWGDYVLRPGVFAKGEDFDMLTDKDGNIVKPDGYLDELLSGGAEIHKWFGIDFGFPMINTSRLDFPDGARPCVIYTDADAFSVSDYGGAVDGKDKGLYITIGAENAETSTSEIGTGVYKVESSDPGAAPQMFIVCGEMTIWARERIHIAKAFPEFPEWVRNTDKGKDWYRHPSSEEKHIFKYK